MFHLVLVAWELYQAILGTTLPNGSTDFLHDSSTSPTQSR